MSPDDGGVGQLPAAVLAAGDGGRQRILDEGDDAIDRPCIRGRRECIASAGGRDRLHVLGVFNSMSIVTVTSSATTGTASTTLL
jgi:hypothetical protein